MFPTLFESIPAIGLTLGIVGFVAATGVGLIITGLFLLPVDKGMGMLFILGGGAIIVVVAIVVYAFKHSDGDYYL